MSWWDFYKIWTYAFTQDPLAKKVDIRKLDGAGTTQPDAIPDIRNADVFSASGGGFIKLRETNDMIDLSTTTNRQARYKEYFRLLQGVAEIEMAITVFADEACVAGNTEIATLYHGYVTIEWLAKNKAGERFPIYSYDADKGDYTIGWAYDPRLVKKEKTVQLYLDNGETEAITADHLIMLRDGSWKQAGELKQGDLLMPFYRLKAKQGLTNLKVNQFPRIFTHKKGWIHERQFVDEWRTGKDISKYERMNKVTRMMAAGLTTGKVTKATGHWPETITSTLMREGFTAKEIRYLAKKPDHRRVLAVVPGKEVEVYDLSVDKHKCFCTRSLVMHNCQRDEHGRVCKITCEDKEVMEELEFLFFHRNMLNMDQRFVWNIAKKTFVNGDWFGELIINPDNPKEGIYAVRELPPESMYRIETTKSKLIEFQQGKEGPDFQSLQRAPITQATDEELRMATAIRFAPEAVIHIRIGDDRKTFYPYGISLIEAARGPAHQLRMMEDAMVVYRLCLTKDARVRTTDGWKHINEIKEGDTVFSCDEHGKIFSTKIIWTVNNGIQKVYKVKSQHCEITGTATHPILVNRDGVIQYVDIENLVPKKDKLINATRDDETSIPIPRIIETSWAKLNSTGRIKFKTKENKNSLIAKCPRPDRAKQFLYQENKSLSSEEALVICSIVGLNPEFDLIICNKYEQKPEIVNLPTHVDEDFARLFGFMLGDGSIRAKGFNQLCFSSSPDKALNQKYADLIIKYFGKIRFERDKRSEKGLGNYALDSRFACRLFLKMGYIPGAKYKRIPAWVFTASKNIRRAFIEGLSDADGCERYTKAGLWFSSINLCNRKLVEDIKEIWHSIGLCSGKITHRKRKGGHEIEPGRTMKPTESWVVTITDRDLPKYENVWSVTSDGEQEVFDVTVDNKYHNIIVNGIITHQTRAPERRVFYIDVAQLPPFKAEAFMERLKDQFRKKKVVTGRGGQGASAVDERWHPPAQDEDYWVPIKPNSNTRIETLPGAENLGEIDDTVYFRNKLFTALNFPKSYFSTEDPNATRITLSAQDVKFARLIERLQSYIEDGLWHIADRHLKLRGFPEETWEDLKIKMTPPSDWRELSRAEVVTNRINNANGLKGSQLMADFDVLTKWMNYTEDEANEMIARMKIQKLEDLKLQVLAQNPQLLGVGIPGQGEQEMGAEPGGPNPMMAPEGGAPPGGPPGAPPEAPPGGAPAPGGPPMPPPDDQQGGDEPGMMPPAGQAEPLPEPSEEDIIKYDLEILDYEREMDDESPDFSEAE